jgi:hypothetical protein
MSIQSVFNCMQSVQSVSQLVMPLGNSIPRWVGRFTDAKEQLKKAVSVRMRIGTAYDTAVSLESRSGARM